MIKRINVLKIIEFIICIIPIAVLFRYVITPSCQFDTIHMGHDWAYHIHRIKEVEEAIKNGVFPIYIGNVGNVVSIDPMLYPYLFLYIPALIDLHVNDICVAVNIFNIIVFFAYFAVSFYSAYVISKNNFLSAVFSITYTMSQYLIFNIYVRAAFGEYVALIFLPLFVAGVYNLFFGDGKKWYIILISLICIFESHIITIFYIAITFAVVCIVCIKKIFKKEIFIKLLKIAVLFLILNLWYIVPLVDCYLNGNTTISSAPELVAHTKFINLLGDESGFYNHYGIEQLVYVGVSLLIISFLSIRKYKSKYFIIGKYLFVVSLIIFIFTYENFITKFIIDNEILSKIYEKQQFTFRTIGRSLTYISLSFAFLVCAFLLYIEENINTQKIKYLGSIVRYAIEILALFLLVTLLKQTNSNAIFGEHPLVKVGKPQYNENVANFFREYNISDNTKNKNMYSDVRTFDVGNEEEIRTSSQDIKLANVEKNYINFDIPYEINSYNEKQKYFIALPYKYYIGFVAYDEEGKRLNTYFNYIKEKIFQNEIYSYPTMMIELKRNAGTVYVKYEPKKSYVIAKNITFWFLRLVLLYYLIKIIFGQILSKKLNKYKSYNKIEDSVKKVKEYCVKNEVFVLLVALFMLVIFIYNSSIKKYYGWQRDKLGYKFVDLYGDSCTNAWIDGAYYVGDDGYMLTNAFIETDGKKYFVGNDGALLIGQEFEYEGKNYIANENGVVYAKQNK